MTPAETSLRAELKRRSAEPNGYANGEILEHAKDRVGKVSCAMCADKELFRAKLSYRSVRFFDTAERAKACEAEQGTAGVTVPKKSSAQWAPDAKPVNRVAVTQCPSWSDDRFKPDPAYVGPFILDWREKRS